MQSAKEFADNINKGVLLDCAKAQTLTLIRARDQKLISLCKKAMERIWDSPDLEQVTLEQDIYPALEALLIPHRED